MQFELQRSLLKPDAERRPLQLQAAFEIGLAILILILALSASMAPTGRAACGVVAAALLGWATWNIAADQHLATTYGEGYCALVPAAVPR